MILYKKPINILLQTNQQDSVFGNYNYKHTQQRKNQCKLGFVCVLDNGVIKESEVLSNEIFNKFNNQ